METKQKYSKRIKKNKNKKSKDENIKQEVLRVVILIHPHHGSVDSVFQIHQI